MLSTVKCTNVCMHNTQGAMYSVGNSVVFASQCKVYSKLLFFFLALEFLSCWICMYNVHIHVYVNFCTEGCLSHWYMCMYMYVCTDVHVYLCALLVLSRLIHVV